MSARQFTSLTLAAVALATMLSSGTAMIDHTCPACKGIGVRELPNADELTPFPCPVCRPWPQGFPGERTLLRGPKGGLSLEDGTPMPREHWIIEPALPGAAAKWNGWPPNPHDKAPEPPFDYTARWTHQPEESTP